VSAAGYKSITSSGVNVTASDSNNNSVDYGTGYYISFKYNGQTYKWEEGHSTDEAYAQVYDWGSGEIKMELYATKVKGGNDGITIDIVHNSLTGWNSAKFGGQIKMDGINGDDFLYTDIFGDYFIYNFIFDTISPTLEDVSIIEARCAGPVIFESLSGDVTITITDIKVRLKLWNNL